MWSRDWREWREGVEGSMVSKHTNQRAASGCGAVQYGVLAGLDMLDGHECGAVSEKHERRKEVAKKDTEEDVDVCDE